MVLLVFILCGFLFFIYTNSKIKEDAIVLVTQVDTRELYCGISVTSPSINSQIHTPFQINGYINGCGWEPYSNYVARLYILDENGKLISRPYLVRKSVSQISPVSTQFNLNIENLPKTEGGVVLRFESFDRDVKTFRLPINLVKAPADEIE